MWDGGRSDANEMWEHGKLNLYFFLSDLNFVCTVAFGSNRPGKRNWGLGKLYRVPCNHATLGIPVGYRTDPTVKLRT